MVDDDCSNYYYCCCYYSYCHKIITVTLLYCQNLSLEGATHTLIIVTNICNNVSRSEHFTLAYYRHTHTHTHTEAMSKMADIAGISGLAVATAEGDTVNFRATNYD